MRHILYSLAALVITTASAQAACFADYKAKQDDPLRLQYGVAEISGDCSTSNAAQQLNEKLATDGWTLLNVLGVFDDAGLDDKKDSAGEYFLRY